MASRAVFTFPIDTELLPHDFDHLFAFINYNYILPSVEQFADVKRTAGNNIPVLSFTAISPQGNWYVYTEITAGKPIRVKMTPSLGTTKETLDELKEDLIINVQLFEERIRETILYFTWIEGEKIIPERPPQRRNRLIRRLFSGSMLPFFIIIIAASILLSFVFGQYLPIALVAFQLLTVLVSDKILIRTGDWRVTEKNPTVHLFEYHLPVEEHGDFLKKFNADTLTKIKTEVYEKTFAAGKALDCEAVAEIMSRYGFECRPDWMSAKRVNIYEIVKNASARFGLPMPRIAIVNTMLPNAAASGPSPSRGVVLITTGLLVQLEDDEILSVVGHEFSHLKGRDPLVLFGLTSGEYLLRVYVLWPFLVAFGLFYLFVSLGLVYFVAKFFEARADLESAIRMGKPKILAEALEKIGFHRLQSERLPSYRILEWTGFDPHPPIYFRIARLERLQAPEEIRHPLIQSMKDNIRGFFAAFG